MNGFVVLHVKLSSITTIQKKPRKKVKLKTLITRPPFAYSIQMFLQMLVYYQQFYTSCMAGCKLRKLCYIY